MAAYSAGKRDSVTEAVDSEMRRFKEEREATRQQQQLLPFCSDCPLRSAGRSGWNDASGTTRLCQLQCGAGRRPEDKNNT